MKKLTTLQTRRQTWHNVELYATHEEARAQGFALMYDEERGKVYGIRSTNPDKPHTFVRVAFVPDRGHFDEYAAQAIDEAAKATKRKAEAEPATLRDICAEVSPAALKQLSDAPAFRFDYNKPHAVRRIRGTFTAAKLAKLTGDGATVSAVIIQTPDVFNRYYNIGRVCLFDGAKLRAVQVPYRSALSYFYGVGDMNDARKMCNNAFIITQATEYTRGSTYNRDTVGGIFLDASNRLARGERARGVKFDYCHTQSGERRYMRVHGKLDNGGASFSFEFGDCGRQYPETKPAPFDASGYYVSIKRDNLKRRAQQLRNERAKAEAQAHDFGAEIAEASDEITAARRAIVATFCAANNWREYKRVASAAQWLTYAAQTLDNLIEKAEAGTFTSIEHGRGYVAKVKEYAKKACAALTEVNA